MSTPNDPSSQYAPRPKRNKWRDVGLVTLHGLILSLITGSSVYYVLSNHSSEETKANAQEVSQLTDKLSAVQSELAELKSQSERRNQAFARSALSEKPSTGTALGEDVSPSITIGQSRALRIQMDQLGWTRNDENNLRPHITGTVELSGQPNSDYYVEFWVNVRHNGRVIGFDQLRVELRQGVGYIDKTLFMVEDAQPNSTIVYELEFKNVAIIEKPTFSVEYPPVPN